MKVDTSNAVLEDVFEIPVGLIDDLCAEFGIQFGDFDIEDSLKKASLDNPKSVGWRVWLAFVEKLKDKLKNDYPDFDESKFSEISEYENFDVLYNDEPFYTKKEFEKILSESKNEESIVIDAF